MPSAAGHALIDRELYLPRSWTADPARCQAAGIPEGTEFATKPELARRMIERALAAGVPVRLVRRRRGLRGQREAARPGWKTRQVRYVLAVSCDHRVPAGAGRVIRADALASRLPRRAWQRLSAGKGAKGHRYYDWAWATIGSPTARAPLAADPPPPPHRGTGLLPLLRPAARHPGHAGEGRRAEVDHRGELPGQQGPGRPG